MQQNGGGKMKEMIIKLVELNSDLSLLLSAIPHKKSIANFYGYSVDKYSFEDETSIIVLWNKIL